MPVWMTDFHLGVTGTQENQNLSARCLVKRSVIQDLSLVLHLGHACVMKLIAILFLCLFSWFCSYVKNTVSVALHLVVYKLISFKHYMCLYTNGFHSLISVWHFLTFICSHRNARMPKCLEVKRKSLKNSAVIWEMRIIWIFAYVFADCGCDDDDNTDDDGDDHDDGNNAYIPLFYL